MTGAPPLWIKNPLAIVTDSAAVSGLVIADVVVFDASEHAVLPVSINTHQRLHKILPRAYPAALDQPPFPWLEALYPIWARLSPDSFFDRHSPGRGGAATVGDYNDFGSSLRLS